MTSFFSINACQFSAQQTMETLVMYVMTFRRLNVALYLTGLVIAYQRSIANSIAMATEILPKVKTKYWELRIWQKTSPAKFPGTGKFSSPMTKAGVIASITPAKITTTKMKQAISGPLIQKLPSCKTFYLKISLICMKMNLCAKHILI